MATRISQPLERVEKALLADGYVPGATCDDRLDLERMIVSFKTCCAKKMSLKIYHRADEHAVYHYCPICKRLEQL